MDSKMSCGRALSWETYGRTVLVKSLQSIADLTTGRAIDETVKAQELQ